MQNQLQISQAETWLRGVRARGISPWSLPSSQVLALIRSHGFKIQTQKCCGQGNFKGWRETETSRTGMFLCYQSKATQQNNELPLWECMELEIYSRRLNPRAETPGICTLSMMPLKASFPTVETVCLSPHIILTSPVLSLKSNLLSEQKRFPK